MKGVPVLGDIEASNSTTPVGLIIQGSIDDQQFNTFIHGPAENYRRVIILPELLAAPSLWVSPIDFEGVLGLDSQKEFAQSISKNRENECRLCSCSIDLSDLDFNRWTSLCIDLDGR